jgi:hypothetical protein
VADRPGADAPISIAEAVRDLLTIVRRLRYDHQAPVVGSHLI